MASFLKRYAPYALPMLLALLYFLLLLRGVNLVTADLGRHLTNGKLFLESFQPSATNAYSYTHPDFPVLNHHWLSGVLFYLVFLLGGFKGAHLFFIAVSVAAFFIFFCIAKRTAGVFLASLAALFFMPLIAERVEVRPEAFSYLLAALSLFFLLNYRNRALSPKKLLIAVALVQIVWVNLHIYFFVGWVLAGVFLFESILASGLTSRATKTLALCFGITVAASLINPFVLEGLMAPFTIFHEYGYRLVENQPVWFLQKLMNRPNLLFFEIAFMALLASFIPAWVRHKNVSVRELIFSLGFGTAAALALRNFTLFALFAFPILAGNIARSAPKDMFSSRKFMQVSTVLLLLFMLLMASGEMRSVFSYPPFRLGLLPNNEGSARFFLEQKLTGPIFNNYDIGGYLIHYLYPNERVFVDNRPEAYPARFFEKVYIPMQDSETVWKEQDERYGFNSIFFSHRDFTPWGQKFLAARLSDPVWVPVYADDVAIIFLKRTQENNSIITRFELPRSVFGTRR